MKRDANGSRRVGARAGYVRRVVRTHGCRSVVVGFPVSAYVRCVFPVSQRDVSQSARLVYCSCESLRLKFSSVRKHVLKNVNNESLVVPVSAGPPLLRACHESAIPSTQRRAIRSWKFPTTQTVSNYRRNDLTTTVVSLRIYLVAETTADRPWSCITTWRYLSSL